MAINKFSDGTPAPAKKLQDGTPAPAVTERENQILSMTPEQEIAANPTATQTGPYLAEKARLSAQKSYDETAAGYRPPRATGRPAVMTAAAKERLDRENANVASWNNRLAIPIQSYPSLAKAMAEAPDLTEADVRRVVNLAAAWTTAQAIESQEIDQGKINILMSLNPVQRGVVVDILSSRASVQEDSRKRARRDQRLAEEERATWGPAKQLAAGFDKGLAELATGFMGTVGTIFEGTLQTAASGANTFFENKRKSGQFLPFQPSLTGDINLVTDLFTQWGESELGQYDDAVIEQARQKYGNTPVDLILEIKQAQIEGDPDPLMTVSSRYVNDPTRAEYLSLLTQRVIDDPEREQQQKDMLALVNRIDSASSSDFGGIVTTNNWFDGQPLDIDNPWRSNTVRVGLAKALNVTAGVVLDPTVALSKGVRIAKGIRYGLEKIASTSGAESVQAALTMPEVYGYINNLTDDVAKYISMRTAGQDTAKFGKAIDNRYRSYFDPSVISDLVKANVTTPEAFIQYVQDTNRMAQIARGEIAVRQEAGALTKEQASKQIYEVESQTVFGRMYGQQGARRSKPLLPGSNIIPTYDITRSISNAIQKIGPTKNRDEEVRRLFGDANDPNKSFGMMLNESAEELGKSARLRIKGGSVSGNISASWDKTSRLLSTTPGVEKIYTKDARDTAVFYKFARMHLPKRQAQLLADEWRNGTQAERVLMWIGTVRTATYARGFEDIRDMVLRLPDGTKTTVDEYVKTLNVGTRTDVMFSPRSIEVFNGESFVPFDTYMGLSSSANDTVISTYNSLANRYGLRPGQYQDISKAMDDEFLTKYPQFRGMTRDEYADEWNKHFYRNLSDDTEITIYRGTSDKGTIDDLIPAENQIIDGASQYWSLNPFLARAFTPEGGDLVQVTTTWGKLKEASGRSFALGPSDQVYGNEAAVVLNYSNPAARALVEDGKTIVDDADRFLSTDSAGFEAGDYNAYGIWAKANTESVETFPGSANIGAIGNDIVRTSPSDFNGIEHPLHLWQTSDYLAVPNMNELQRITKRNKLIRTVQGMSDGVSPATELVNWWSLLNLAGPRYATRNAFEDIGLYALTGGYLMDYIKGATSAKGIREARGLNPGILARVRRKIGGEAKPGDEDYSIWENVFKPQLNRQERQEALLAAESGDLVKLRQLALKATIRLEAGRLLSVDEERYLVDFVSSHGAFAKLDEVSQTTYYAASGVQPGVDVSVIPVGGMTTGEGVVVYPRGEYTNILMNADAGQKLDGARFIYWHRNIRKTITSDGPFGRIAIANLDNPEEATRLIAREFAKPSSLEYKQRLAAFYDVRVNVSDDEFARRYIQDVYNTFSRADGSLNTDLWRKFIAESSDGTRTVRFTKMVNGKKQPAVTVDDLRKMNVEDMPKYVLGRETSREAIAVNMGWDDKTWSVLGNMVARISKEPIFMANYFRARKQLTAYEERLIEEIGPDLARETVTRHALDRATTVSFSYTDNPANQTILAWRLRNWARYYRATEDFYRRVYRMGKFEPIGFYKAALTLNALENQGFVYNDDYGDKYFIYPGDGLVNTAIHGVASLFGNTDSMMFGTTPLIFGGKVKMLAPSLDPKAAIPTLSGPISSISFKLLAGLVPALQPVEKYVLGEYSIGKTIAETSLSSSVVRFLAMMDRNERDSIFASSYMSAVKILTAAGKMPELTEGNKDKAQQDIARLTRTVIITRFAAGFIYQASPQIMENDVTWFARQYGTPSMSSDYIGRVKKFREAGETDPYGMALQEGVSIFGPSYAAYSESESERGEGLKSLPELNYTEETLKFIKDNESLVSKYPASSQFLAPQADGELSVPAIMYYADKEIRVPRSYVTYIEDIAYAEGKFYYYKIMRDYRAAVDAAENAGEVSKAESAKKVATTNLYRDYPGLQSKIKESMDIAEWEKEALNRDNPESVRRMVEDYYDGKFGAIPNSVKYIAESLSTYDYFTTEINKISGSSAPEKTAKTTYKGALLKSLQDIARDDVNAEMFIRRVLYPILNADREGNVE